MAGTQESRRPRTPWRPRCLGKRAFVYVSLPETGDWTRRQETVARLWPRPRRNVTSRCSSCGSQSITRVPLRYHRPTTRHCHVMFCWRSKRSPIPKRSFQYLMNVRFAVTGFLCRLVYFHFRREGSHRLPGLRGAGWDPRPNEKARAGGSAEPSGDLWPPTANRAGRSPEVKRPPWPLACSLLQHHFGRWSALLVRQEAGWSTQGRRDRQ